MHPSQFVRQMLTKGQSDVLIEMLDKTSQVLFNNRGEDEQGVYRFAQVFLLDVMNSLKAFPPDGDINDEKVLSVWAELAFFGIKRDDINDFLDNEYL